MIEIFVIIKSVCSLENYCCKLQDKLDTAYHSNSNTVTPSQEENYFIEDLNLRNNLNKSLHFIFLTIINNKKYI
jgi:hypothetical protein